MPFKPTGIETRIRRAVDVLFEKDRVLLELGVHERSITHKLAMYLEHEFPGRDVDCEYNKSISDVKKLENLPECIRGRNADDNEGSRVYPDIIVHRRGKKNENLLVIEVKTSSKSSDCDKAKLREFKRQLSYEFGVFLKLNTGSRFSSSKVIEDLCFIEDC